jgi:EmrB/QacA subfamily drug resistance transporter
LGSSGVTRIGDSIGAIADTVKNRKSAASREEYVKRAALAADSGEDLTDYKWVALSNTTLGVLMSSLDGNIVLIALPTIAKDLPGTSLIDLLWILLGYQLVTASVLVNFGRLADMFGRVRLYNFGFAVFTAGSALCGLSQNSEQLIAFRMVQAIGAAFLFSNSAAIITDAFPLNERGRALGTNQVAIVVGSVMGLVLGGFLTSAAGWRSIFWVNVPIGIFATAWSHYRLREQGLIKKGQRLDIPGNITFAAGLTCVLLAITLYAVSSLALQEFYSLIAAGVALLAAFAFIERWVRQPMLDFSLFRIRMFTAGNIAIFLNALARGAVSLVLVFYLQGPTMGLDPLAAGIFLIPISASLALFGPISGWLSDNHGARVLSTMGLLVSSVGFLLLTGIGTTITFQQLVLPLVLIGSGMGMFASPNRASIMNSVSEEARGIASGVSVTLVNVGATLSLGVAFLIMTVSMPIPDLEKIFLGSGGLSNAPWIGDFITSVHSVFYLSTVVLLGAIIPSVMRGRRNNPAPRSTAPT